MTTNNNHHFLQLMANFFAQNPNASLYYTANDDGVYFKLKDNSDAIHLGVGGDFASTNIRNYIEKTNNENNRS